VDLTARHWCAKGFCVAVGFLQLLNLEEDLAVTISPELEAQILRYYHVEKWRVGTIARHLRLHSDTVARVLAQAGVPALAQVARPSQIDAYLPFIRKTLEKFPTLTASRLYVMARERGYRGGPDHFRHLIARYRSIACSATRTNANFASSPPEDLARSCWQTPTRATFPSPSPMQRL
jgi:hypothetical protein